MIIGIANTIGNSNRVKESDGLVPLIEEGTDKPIITGDEEYGSLLSCSTGNWSSEDDILKYSYQWYKDSEIIEGETSNEYTTTIDDVGSAILCRVAATDLDGRSEFIDSQDEITVTS